MAQLAIKGHKERGEEVIKILEMLGGEDEYKLRGNNEESAYFEKKGVIYNTNPTGFNNIKLFTLEEFLEKFPYKVGDKVSSKYLKNYEISKMEWESINNRVIYKLRGMGWYSADELQPYKEETMEEKKINQMSLANCDLDEVEIILGDKFELKIKEGKYYAVKKKLHYPKTYEECAILLNTYCGSIGGYNWKLLSYFQQLLVCRDAYWEIVGEQMELGKPWKPDWLNVEQDKYVLFTHNDAICSNCYVLGHNFLAFPTKEMRDAFYENFKELIENCKELL